MPANTHMLSQERPCGWRAVWPVRVTAGWASLVSSSCPWCLKPCVIPSEILPGVAQRSWQRAVRNGREPCRIPYVSWPPDQCAHVRTSNFSTASMPIPDALICTPSPRFHAAPAARRPCGCSRPQPLAAILPPAPKANSTTTSETPAHPDTAVAAGGQAGCE